MDAMNANDQNLPNIVLVTEDDEEYDYDYEDSYGPDYEGGYNDF
jgi:hypothetical protein